MKRLILLELILLFLATTFRSDSTGGWVQQTLPRTDVTIQDIFFLDSLNGWVVANKYPGSDSTFIFVTTNGGSTWLAQYSNNQVLAAIQFTDLLNGYSAGGTVGGTGKVYKTINGGVNWNLTLTAGHGFTDIFFVNQDTGWICDDDGFVGAGLLKTTNGGLNWSQQLTASSEPSKLFFLNKDTGWAICQQMKILKTTNSGLNWIQTASFPQNLGSLFFTGSDTGFVSGGGGSASIKITTDGGYNWINSNNSTGGNAIYFVTKKIGYNCAVFSDVEKTTDGGFNWFNQTVPNGNYISIHFPDSLNGWSGGSKLIHTTDGGGPPVGIQQISSEVPRDFVLYQNYPNPFNPKTVISYQLSVSSYVRMAVYDISGKNVVDLVNQKQNPGTYQVDFDGSNLSSGIYFYQLIVSDGQSSEADPSASHRMTKRMVFLK